MGEAKRRTTKGPPEPPALGKKEGEDTVTDTGFYVVTEGNRVVLQFDRDINFLQLTGRAAVNLGGYLIEKGRQVRSRRATPPPDSN